MKRSTKRSLRWLKCTKWKADKLKEMLGDAEKEQMKKDMAVQEAVTILAESAKEVEKTEE